MIQTSGKITYESGFKHQLLEPFWVDTGLLDCAARTDFLFIDQTGRMCFEPGFAWDGASGPAIDTPNIMRGSLVHDGGYRLMREGKLPQSLRKHFDKLLVQICRQDGMSGLRSRWILWGVRRFAAGAAKRQPHGIHKAP